jgi:cytochrome c oxidase cbb3-type subunit 4
MDHGTLSGIVTALLVLIFIRIVVWAWSERSRAGFEEAARLALEPETQARSGERPS